MAPTANCPSERVAAIEAEIRAALILIQRAESALVASDLPSATILQDGADQACTTILRRITRLDELAADSIEPAFSRFEEKLLRLSRILSKETVRFF
jgi:hypothetical protein